MNVGSICRREVVTVTPQIDLVAAAQVMRERHVGFLVVVEPEPKATYGRPIGVLTDRDIVVSIVARGADPKLLTVADLMKRYPAMVDEADPLDQALHTMRRMGVRRLPVVGSAGMLSGVIALDDMLAVLCGEGGEAVDTVRHEQQNEARLR
ncbi:MAG: CBS domain-containing protein [Steroidobacteraceae bacterium]